MQVISYGAPSMNGRVGNPVVMMGRKYRCHDCYCDGDECPRECGDCGRYGYCDGDCGCDDEADCYFD